MLPLNRHQSRRCLLSHSQQAIGASVISSRSWPVAATMKALWLVALTVLLMHCAPAGQLSLEPQVKRPEEDRKIAGETATQLFRSSHDLVLGNPDGQTTVAEFFDYNCSFCKRNQPEVAKLIQSNPDVRVVIKEYPILGAASLFAAKAALASSRQGKYREFHNALNRANVVKTQTNVLQMAKDIGLDVDVLQKDMQNPEIEQMLASNRALARSLSIDGTPAFVVGDQLLQGFSSYETLRQSVAVARGE
jgi:protein-disulfide isomerase